MKVKYPKVPTSLTAIQILSNIWVKVIVDYSTTVVRIPVADAPHRSSIPHNGRSNLVEWAQVQTLMISA